MKKCDFMSVLEIYQWKMMNSKHLLRICEALGV